MGTCIIVIRNKNAEKTTARQTLTTAKIILGANSSIKVSSTCYVGGKLFETNMDKLFARPRKKKS